MDDERLVVSSVPSGTQVLTVRIPDAVAEPVLERAFRTGTPLSDVVTEALEAYLAATG